MICLGEPVVEARYRSASKPQKIQFLFTLINLFSYFVPRRDIHFSGAFSYITAS